MIRDFIGCMDTARKKYATLKEQDPDGPVIIFFLYHTTQNSQNKWMKISGLETNIFGLKMMMKSGLENFILKFYQPLQKYLLAHWSATVMTPLGKINKPHNDLCRLKANETFI